MAGASLLPVIAQISAIAGCLAAVVAATWLAARPGRFGAARSPLIAALLFTAVWAGLGATPVSGAIPLAIGETLRDLSWLLVLYRLFAIDGRLASVRPVRPVLLALVFVVALHVPLQLISAIGAAPQTTVSIAFHTDSLLRLLLSVGGLMLVHNLYVGASQQARLALRWPAFALAAIWLFDLNFFTIAYLVNAYPDGLGAVRALVGLAVAVPLLLGASQASDQLRFSPSRAVTFQTISLLLIAAYMFAMIAIAQWLAYSGGDWARLIQLAFVAMASLLAITVLPSQRLRGWLRVTLAKHLFQHRYDYRAEWLRFTRTIGEGEASGASLDERIIRALADITDSPAGLLLTQGEQGELVLAARWQWPTADVPAVALGDHQIRFFEHDGFIVDLDELRAGRIQRGEDHHVPSWLRDDPRSWVLVPLLHFERLVGMVVLARPPLARRLDWEDLDLLRVAGQQLASYLAEHAGQAALAEATRFDDFNRRIAFVMHDIKNLASQLSLLARNAEQHAGNPEFQSDMLVTLRNSADKLNTLLARLSRYGAGPVDAVQPIRADQLAARVVEQFRGQHEVVLVEAAACEVAAQAEPLEQALVHLVQNAIDASATDSPVFVRVGAEHLHGFIEVTDSGLGMSPEFVRTRLFKPFVSSKQGGFGIGAYEAQALVRAMRGRLEVESREGLGSRFIIRLPLAEASDLFKSIDGKRVA